MNKKVYNYDVFIRGNSVIMTFLYVRILFNKINSLLISVNSTAYKPYATYIGQSQTHNLETGSPNLLRGIIILHYSSIHLSIPLISCRIFFLVKILNLLIPLYELNNSFLFLEVFLVDLDFE